METIGLEPTTPCLQNRIEVAFAVLLARNTCWPMAAYPAQKCWSAGVHASTIDFLVAFRPAQLFLMLPGIFGLAGYVDGSIDLPDSRERQAAAWGGQPSTAPTEMITILIFVGR